MTSLLWERRMDVALCLLLQTSLIGGFQLLQTLGTAKTHSPAVQNLTSLGVPRV